MKAIIAGGREYHLNAIDISSLESIHRDIKITQVVSGGAKGADTCGELWAKAQNIPVKRFPADWNHLGKSAGYIRNEQMAQYSQVCILFPGGKGTDHMFDLAKKYKLVMFDFRTQVVDSQWSIV